jgi:hypothetical protein
VVSGGEPFVYEGLYDLWRKHSDMWFQVYTSGVALNDANVAKLAELGNVMPCISVEGFETETDKRRGNGHFKKLLQAFARLRNAGIPFGISATATRNNNDFSNSPRNVRAALRASHPGGTSEAVKAIKAIEPWPSAERANSVTAPKGRAGGSSTKATSPDKPAPIAQLAEAS